MSVATTVMTMDDQRPNVVMNTYDKLSSKPYEQSLSAVGGSGGAPASGPASPTPSGSEEPHAYQHHNAHHHHHSSHHQHQYHQQQQLMPPTALSATQQLQQQQELKQPSNASAAEAVAAAEHRQRLLEEEVDSLKLEQTRLAQQCVDAQRREKILMRRLANKEQEFQDYVSQIAEYKAAQAPSALALRSALLDPAVNLLFEKLKKELKATKAKLEETQNELSAWKFTPDSNTGKRLMAKCRLLYQENEELGKMTSNGRLAKLETELAMQKSFSEEVKKSQSELDDFLQELDEDVEGMQSTILFLQQELKTTRDRIQLLEKDNYQLRSGGSDDIVVKDDVAPLALGLGGAELNGDSGSGSGNNSHKCLNENEGVYNVGNTIDKHDSNDNVNDNDTSTNLAHQQQTPPAYNSNTSNNNNIIINAPTVLVSTSSSYAANTSDMRYQPSTPLETIDENVCLRMAPASAERFNGEEQVVAVGVNVVDDGGGVCMTNTNSISLAPGGGCVGVLRTAGSRKRPYDAGLEVASISDQYVDLGPAPTPEPVLMTPTPLVAVGTHVTAPRTLPPKKSKLRVMPIQRLCALTNDPNEAESYTTNMGVGVGVLGMGVGVGVGAGVGVGVGGGGGGVVVENLHFFDNNAAAAANITNEETIITSSGVGVVSTTTVASMSMGEEVMVIDGTAGNGNGSAGMAQRIMTRRRSLRTQQNGGDSSH